MNIPGSLLDREAQDRATSVYLADRRLNMLPEVCDKKTNLFAILSPVTFILACFSDPKRATLLYAAACGSFSCHGDISS